jgi:hypothetical protein
MRPRIAKLLSALAPLVALLAVGTASLAATAAPVGNARVD